MRPTEEESRQRGIADTEKEKPLTDPSTHSESAIPTFLRLDSNKIICTFIMLR
jgi:hypothetical protein